MKKPFKYLLLALVGAATAAWLKLLLPEFPDGQTWGDASWRNRIGIAIAMPLYELYYFWWGYLLVIIELVIMEKTMRQVRYKKPLALLLCTLTGGLLFVAYKLYHYMIAASIYKMHASGHLAKPWYKWIELPLDAELLVVYLLAGLFVGYTYYRWSVKPPTEYTGRIIEA